MAVVADQIERLDQTSVGKLCLEEFTSQNSDTVASDSGTCLIHLRAHAAGRP